MKPLKLICITILTFLFIHISTAEIIDLNNDKFINKRAGFSFYNYDSLSDISQEVLLQLSAKNEISQINLPLTNYDLSEKRRIYVSYKNGKVMQNSNCKLICVSETGIYTYSKRFLF